MCASTQKVKRNPHEICHHKICPIPHIVSLSLSCALYTPIHTYSQCAHTHTYTHQGSNQGLLKGIILGMLVQTHTHKKQNKEKKGFEPKVTIRFIEKAALALWVKVSLSVAVRVFETKTGKISTITECTCQISTLIHTH